MRPRGVRVDFEDGKYRILLMGNFSQAEPSKEMIMCPEDFYNLLEQGNRLKEVNDGTSI